MANVNMPQKLASGVYWIGLRRNVRLETNTYVRVFQKTLKSEALLIDPGAPRTFNPILKRIKAVIGDFQRLGLVFFSYQDPGSSVNIAQLAKENPSLTVVCTNDVRQLSYSFGLKGIRFQSIEKLPEPRIPLSEDYVIHFLPVPFCPSRGACMVYDEESRILFSGGLFGGVTFTLPLIATKQHWEGIRIWHQMYIPHVKALQRAIEIVRTLDPPPKMIAPHHGAILTGEMIPMVLEKLSDLPVGVDLPQATELDKIMYLDAINDVLASITQKAGKDVVEKLLGRLDQDLSFPHLFTIQEGRLVDIRDDVLGNVMGAFKMLLYALIQDQPSEIQDILRAAILESNWNLPLFMQTFVSRK